MNERDQLGELELFEPLSLLGPGIVVAGGIASQILGDKAQQDAADAQRKLQTQMIKFQREQAEKQRDLTVTAIIGIGAIGIAALLIYGAVRK